jgi:DNA-binding HxlR family transcriptional regulator
VEYSLTGFGETLRPVLESMCEWGATYLDHAAEPSPESVGES